MLEATGSQVQVRAAGPSGVARLQEEGTGKQGNDMGGQEQADKAHGAPASAEASALRRKAARAWWLRSSTDNSWRRSACTSPASEPTRAATARERSWRVLAAVGSQAPVDSATRGKKRTPWAAQVWAVFWCALFTAAYWEAPAAAC